MTKSERDELRRKIKDNPSDINPVLALDLLDTIDELERKLSIAQEALLWSEEMFTARDEMNSKVHCAPVRLSPITERVRQARKALEE